MAVGPGKYDDLCTLVRETAKADGVIVVVVNGDRGNGFAIQGDIRLAQQLPDILEHMAQQIREDIIKEERQKH